MDRIGSGSELLIALLPLVLRLVPLLAIGGAAWFLVRSEFGRALTGRLRAHADRNETVAALSAEMEDVRRELAEVHERLDFDERLLARGVDAEPHSRSHDERTPTPPGFAAAARP